MIKKSKKASNEKKETLITIIAFLPLITVLGFVFRDVIEVALILLLVLVLMNLDSISTYVRKRAAEKEQQQVEKAQNMQIIHGILGDVIFRGLTGHLGKTLGVIPPSTIMDIYPIDIPLIQTLNGVTTFHFEFHLPAGSQPIPEDVMKRIVDSNLKKLTSGLLPPKPGSTFSPYFHTVAITTDSILPDTFILHIIFVDDSLADNYVDNLFREEAEEHRRKLVDTQPPDDKEF